MNSDAAFIPTSSGSGPSIPSDSRPDTVNNDAQAVGFGGTGDDGAGGSCLDGADRGEEDGAASGETAIADGGWVTTRRAVELGEREPGRTCDDAQPLAVTRAKPVTNVTTRIRARRRAGPFGCTAARRTSGHRQMRSTPAGNVGP